VHAGSISTLKAQLSKRIQWIIEHPNDIASPMPRQELERMAKHILNHLRAHNFTMVSFERVRRNINSAYSDDLLQQLIEYAPDRFRRVLMSGGRPGIGKLTEKGA